MHSQVPNVGVIDQGLAKFFGSATEWTVYYELLKCLESLEVLLECNVLERTLASIPKYGGMKPTHSVKVKI